MAKLNNPANVDIPVEAKTLHDVDFYAFGPMDYAFKGDVPVVDGNTLNYMFPKGFDLGKFKNDNESNKKLFWLGWMEWQKAEQIIMEQWDYEGLFKDMTKSIFEFSLLQNGTIALIKFGGELYLQKYSFEKLDIYGNPKVIKIISNNKFLNNRLIPKDRFVIFNDTRDSMPIYNKIIQPITAMNETLRFLIKNLRSANPKNLLLDTFGSDKEGDAPLKKLFEAVAKSDDSYYVAQLSKDQLDMFSKWASTFDSKSISVPLELRDRTTELIDNYSFFKNVFHGQLGLPVDFNQDKGERKITGEISTQQAMSYSMLLHRFNMRKEALDEANKKFGLNMSIKWTKRNEMIFNPQEPKEISGEVDGNGDRYDE